MDTYLILFVFLLLVSFLTIKYTHLAIDLFYINVPYNITIEIRNQELLWLLYGTVMFLISPYLLVMEIFSSLKYKWINAHNVSINKVFKLEDQ